MVRVVSTQFLGNRIQDSVEHLTRGWAGGGPNEDPSYIREKFLTRKARQKRKERNRKKSKQ